MASKYYSFTKIDKTGATYRLIIGQRSNGKTFGACRKILEEYIKTGKPSVYVRRMEEMIRPMNIEGLFKPHAAYIEEATEHKYNAFVYRQHKFYLARYDTTDSGAYVKTAQDINPFCFTYAISTAETTKGTDPGEIYAVLSRTAAQKECYERFICGLMPGDILPARVTHLEPFGAFVDIGVKHDGLVHISQLSEKFIKSPRDIVAVGDIVKVKVIGIDLEKQKVALSMKGII